MKRIFILVLLIGLIVLVALSCRVKNDTFYKNKLFELTKSKSEDGITQIVIESYEFQNRKTKIPASIRINGVVRHSSFKKQLKPIVIHLVPDKYKLDIFFIGKQTLTINKFLIERGDSIFIRTYLKEDLTPIN